LGLDGDYEGMFTWLDQPQAKKWGLYFSVIKDYSYQEDFLTELKE